MEHPIIPERGEVEAAGSEVQGYPHLHNEFKFTYIHTYTHISFKDLSRVVHAYNPSTQEETEGCSCRRNSVSLRPPWAKQCILGQPGLSSAFQAAWAKQPVPGLPGLPSETQKKRDKRLMADIISSLQYPSLLKQKRCPNTLP